MKWRSIPIILGPAIGYGMAFIREWSYCNYFGIPTEFIKLDLTNIIIAIIEGMGLVLIIAFTLYVYHFYCIRPEATDIGPIKRRLLQSLPTMILFFYFLIRYPSWQWGIVGIFLVIWMLYLHIGIPLNEQRGIKGFHNKLAEADKTRRELPKIFKDIRNRIGISVFPLMIILIFLLAAPYLGGSLQASNKQDFLIPSTNPNSVVLKIYGDNLVCAPFDAETNIVEKSFFILNVNDEPRPLLELTKIGRLKSADVPIPELEGNTTGNTTQPSS